LAFEKAKTIHGNNFSLPKALIFLWKFFNFSRFALFDLVLDGPPLVAALWALEAVYLIYISLAFKDFSLKSIFLLSFYPPTATYLLFPSSLFSS
jgi:hypothetical protein